MLRMKRKVVTWTLIVFGLLVVGVVAAVNLTSLGEEDRTTKGEQASVVGVAEPVVLHGMRHRVTGVRKAKRLYAQLQPSKYDEPRQAQGVYVAVNLAVENVGDEPVSGSIHESTFIGGDGKTYALGALSNGTTIAELQPGFPDRARLVFDVDPAAVRGGSLGLATCPYIGQLEPGQGCASAKVVLGPP